MVLLPILIIRQQTRARASVVAALYFLSASAALPSVWNAYFPGERLTGILVWVLASVLLALPWALVWSGDANQHAWRACAALCLSCLPPFGLIGWASPLTVAGLLLPGTGLIGLIGTALIEVKILDRPLVVGAVAIAANFAYLSPQQPLEVEAIQTVETASLFEKEDAIRASVARSKAKLIILPEGAIRRWTEATEAYWAQTIIDLCAAHRVALVGTGISIDRADGYRNSVVAVGDTPPFRFDQRVPIPFGMWRPWGSGVPLNLTGPGTLSAQNHRIAILICYEQLLVWPVLMSALERPTLIAGISNAAWTKNTYLPAAQRACVEAWARLFRIPHISAQNL